MTIALIQARLGSSRFPEKALAELDGHPLIWHVVNQARQIRGVESVMVLTPHAMDGRAMAAVLPRVVPVVWYPGVRESDVLSRFVAAMRYRDHHAIVRLTGDCPRLDPERSAAVIDTFHASGVEYAWNPGADGDEADTEVFTRETLFAADRHANDPSDREHVTPWMRRNRPCLDVLVEPRAKHSIDTPADLVREAA